MLAGDERDTRARLLENARDLYLEEGPQRFSLREVARRTKVSPAAVYRHFENKEALLGAVCEEGFRLFSSYLLRSLSEPSPFERLRAAGDMYRRFGLENPHDYRVIFMSDAGEVLTTQHRAAGKTNSPTFQFLVDRVGECMKARALARGDATEIAAVIWAHVHGLVSLRLCGQLCEVGDDEAFARFYRSSTDRLLKGLAP
jgi:AcrR family transcriptional regulator